MNDTPFMRQMDALLKKHRGSADPAFDASASAPQPAAPGVAGELTALAAELGAAEI